MQITVEAVAGTEQRGSVIDEQRRNRLRLDTKAVRDIGDSHEYDMLES